MKAAAVSASARQSRRAPAAPQSKSRQFTLNRQQARDIEDRAVADALREWLAEETGCALPGSTSEELLEQLESGAVLCKLAARFGQVLRFKDPPANEFQRIENFSQFAKACAELDLACAAPSARRPLHLRETLPCLLALAALAESKAELPKAAPAVQLQTAATTPGPSKPPAQPALDYAGDAESSGQDTADSAGQEEEEVSVNQLLKGLHELRTARQRAAPPKLRLVQVGATQVIVVERPGESVGSILWRGGLILAQHLNDQSRALLRPDTKVLEIGAGVGLVGVWAACQGTDVVVTELDGPSLDLLWANVAANAQNIVKAGGACSARALDFNDREQADKLLGGFKAEEKLLVVAADVLYNETVQPLTACVRGLFAIRPDLHFYLCYKPRDAPSERVFFQDLAAEVEFACVATENEHEVWRGVKRV
jgi:predicted nicotinamide N-methyase